MEPFDNAKWSTTKYDTQNLNKYVWRSESLDHCLQQQFKEQGISSGTLLDIGTCDGSQASNLAKLGFTVTGTDINHSILDYAKTNISNVNFVYDNILRTNIKEKFDYVFDRGCYHWIEKRYVPLYVANVKSLTKKFLYIKVLKQRSSIEEIQQFFEHDFDIISHRDNFFNEGDSDMPSLFVVLQPKVL